MIKTKLQQIAAALLVTVALAAPLSLNAADTTTSGAAAATATPKAKKEKAPATLTLTGKVSKVNKDAKTFTVGKHTLAVSDTTKWDEGLSLDSLVVETTKVTVSYTKTGDTFNAVSVKVAKEAKPKASATPKAKASASPKAS